jgi:glycerol-3-phosphate O-acyltransferase
LIDQKKDMLHPIIHAKPEYKNVLMLAYYRNTLLHVFWLEALLACALSSFGQEMAWKDGVSIERLWEELSFLSELMIREVQLRTKLNRDTYPGLLKSMIERKILKENDGKITVKKY